MTLVFVDTSFEYAVKLPELMNTEVVTHSTIAKFLLRANRPHCVAKLLLDVIQDPEVWLSVCLQLTNYCLTHSKVFIDNKVSKSTWVNLYNHCRKRKTSYDYLLPTVEFCIVKIGYKMLSLGLVDDALFIAFKLNNT